MNERVFDCGCILRCYEDGRMHGELCEAHAHSPTTKNMLLNGKEMCIIILEIQRRRREEGSH